MKFIIIIIITILFFNVFYNFKTNKIFFIRNNAFYIIFYFLFYVSLKKKSS